MPLYLIATPLGNLEDISLRAKRILAAAPVLAAEDTRSARRLLSALEIPLGSRTLLAYGEHNEQAMSRQLGERLREGVDVALLSEGGTPLVSDPGFRLVREAVLAGVAVVPVPGPCAAIAALSASGLPVHGFLFRGFLPKKPGARRRILDSLVAREETLIFYESPQRLVRLLDELGQVLGPDRPACLAREMTKFHEAFLRLPLTELKAAAEELERAGRLKGECTVLVAGAPKDAEEAPA